MNNLNQAQAQQAQAQAQQAQQAPHDGDPCYWCGSLNLVGGVDLRQGWDCHWCGGN